MTLIKQICFLVLMFTSITTLTFSQEMCVADLVNPSKNTNDTFQTVVSLKTKWSNGQKIKVTFLDGSESLKKRVIHYAEQWEQYANIDFVFGDFDVADIKITFRDQGYWSYVGTNSKYYSPSMSLTGLTINSDDEISRVVLHEFGHALGLHHEHQNTGRNFEWNEEEVYKKYSGSPNYWSRDKIYRNLIKMYSDGSEYTNYRYDSNSIMHYPIPAKLTKNGYSVGWNTSLSSQDKDVIGKIYPFTNAERKSSFSVSNTLGENQVQETVTMKFYNSAGGSIQTFNLDTAKATQVNKWNFTSSGKYCYQVWSKTNYSDGTLIKGYGEGCVTLDGGSNYSLELTMVDERFADGQVRLRLKDRNGTLY